MRGQAFVKLAVGRVVDAALTRADNVAEVLDNVSAEGKLDIVSLFFHLQK